jgi:GT2 family glycosyltransferase
MIKQVTVVITTCGRTDLLEKTLISFYKFNTYPINKVVIVEDSGIPQNFETVKTIVQDKLEIIVNETNEGQIPSIDKAYATVETDYIFHCEEDWEFFHSGFIEKSFEILDQDSKIFTVWLRAHSDTKNHGIEKDKKFLLPSDDYYYLMNQYHKKVWCGFTFNPGLRRTSDCMIFYPYNNLEVRELSKKNGMPVMHEMDLSIYYQELGYRGAITSNENGYVRHIGGKRHIPLPWQKH